MAPTNNVDLTAIMTALGGRQALQDLLGVGASAISNYVARGTVPTHVRSKLYGALTARGYQVRLDDLAILCAPDAPATAPAKPMVLLIIGGGIASYKALETARQMQRLGLDVTGVITKSAAQFITPLSVAALTNQKCYDDLFSLTDEAEMGHIRLARSADLVLVMPATANLMARAAAGIADDLATTILLATTAPVLMAPAMNPADVDASGNQRKSDNIAAAGRAYDRPDRGRHSLRRDWQRPHERTCRYCRCGLSAGR
jgi:phosphopantothenoylcysteine decarboxylase/phosphopantothenate--cysteine ligase